MPTEPKGKRRPTDMSGNAIRVAQIATGEVVRRQAREERGRRRDGAPLARSFTRLRRGGAARRCRRRRCGRGCCQGAGGPLQPWVLPGEQPQKS